MTESHPYIIRLVYQDEDSKVVALEKEWEESKTKQNKSKQVTRILKGMEGQI